MTSAAEGMLSDIFQKEFSAPVTICSKPETCPLEDRFLVLPGNYGYPRWIVPTSAEYGKDVLNQWRPFGFLSPLKWKAFLAVYGMGMARYIPGVREVGIQKTEASWAHLGRSPDEVYVPVIYVGTPSAVTKLVSVMVDVVTKKPSFVAKIPLEENAKAKILNEAATLKAVCRRQADMVPRVLFSDSETGIAVQEFIKGRPIKPGLNQRHIDFLVGLQWDKSATINAGHVLNDLHARIESAVFDQIQKAHALRVLERLKPLSESISLPVVLCHGDFSAWNLYGMGEKLLLLDWEEARLEGLPLYDLIHYQRILALLEGRPPDLFQCFISMPLIEQYMSRLGLSAEMGRLLYTVYFLEFCCRYWECGDTDWVRLFYNKTHMVWESGL